MFIEELERNPVVIEKRHAFIVSKSDARISEQDRKIVAFSNAVRERFSVWRARNTWAVGS